MFIKNGYTKVDFNDFSDIYIINTCTVTNTSDQKSRKMIRQARKRNENALVVVMGCYSQKNAEYILSNCGAHIVLGTSGRNTIMQCLNEYISTKVKIININNDVRHLSYEDFNVIALPKSTRAYVKIQDGCNNFCS